MDIVAVNQLAQKLQTQAASHQLGNEIERHKLLATSKELIEAIETPSERIARMCYTEPYLFIATRILIDLDVFRTLANAKDAVTVQNLADKTGADGILLGRLLKNICTQNFVLETGSDEYVANALTYKISSPEGQGAILNMFQLHRINDRLPDYLKERKYRNPTNKDDTAFKYAMNTNDHYFEYISRPGRENEAEAFYNHMRFKTLGLKWHQIPTIMENVFGGYTASKDDILMVDVGGGSGYDLVDFQSEHPALLGRLILQDLPQSIKMVKSGGELEKSGIEALEHNFFTAEVVRGARVYYLKMVLHDWPDEQCKQILSNLKPALEPGHSRILLNEIIIPETNAGWFETSMDLIMMSFHSAQERREKHWRSMVESVGGLRVSNIWNVDGAVEKIIEIVMESESGCICIMKISYIGQQV